MAPKLPTSVIDTAPFEKLLIENPGNQITTLHNTGMINEFLELYRLRSLIGEECEELQEFLNQVSEFERKYEISFSLLLKVKQESRRSDLFSLQNPILGVNPFIFMDLVDLMRQAEIIQKVQVRHGKGGVNETRLEKSPPPPNYDNAVVNIPLVVTPDQVCTTLSGQQILPLPIQEPSDALLQPEKVKENINGRRRRHRAKKSMKLGSTFFPLTVQAGLAVFTSVFGSRVLSSSTEAKQLVHIAAVSNVVGYIGCLADILLRYHGKRKAAEMIGRIGSTAAVFGLLTMMGTVLGLKPAVMIGIAAITALFFFLAVIKH